jgi:hypothetical protein
MSMFDKERNGGLIESREVISEKTKGGDAVTSTERI